MQVLYPKILGFSERGKSASFSVGFNTNMIGHILDDLGVSTPILGSHHLNGDGIDGAVEFDLLIVKLVATWIHPQARRLNKNMPKIMKIYIYIYTIYYKILQGMTLCFSVNQNGGGDSSMSWDASINKYQQDDRLLLGVLIHPAVPSTEAHPTCRGCAA